MIYIETLEDTLIFGGALGVGGKSRCFKEYHEYLEKYHSWAAQGHAENTHTPAKFYTTPIVSVDKNSLISKLVRKL